MAGRDGGTPTDNGPLSPVVDSVSDSHGKVKGENPIAGSIAVCENVGSVARYINVMIVCLLLSTLNFRHS